MDIGLLIINEETSNFYKVEISVITIHYPWIICLDVLLLFGSFYWDPDDILYDKSNGVFIPYYFIQDPFPFCVNRVPYERLW